ncbi:hypothetical protein TA05_08105 [Citrobacter rodentium]|nr:hypothetical protein TA05_08105 [Citrobacter rodentium]
MLGHNRGHDAIQIVSRIIFYRSLLYGVAHNFGQMLAHPPGDIMHALTVDSLNKLCQMVVSTSAMSIAPISGKT